MKTSRVIVKQALDGQLYKSQYGKIGIVAQPMQTLLSALIGCEHLVMKSLIPKFQMNIQHIEYEAQAIYESKKPKVEEIRIDVRLRSADTDNKLNTLFEKVEKHCLVASIFHDANIPITHTWTRIDNLQKRKR